MPGYRVWRGEIDEHGIAEVSEREVRDLPCFEYRTTVVMELYRSKCPDCGLRTEKVPNLPGKAPKPAKARRPPRRQPVRR
jgi:hypothetical protein